MFSTNVIKHPIIVTDVIELVKQIQRVRDGWPQTKHSSKTYAVTHEDTIKMHINMYLGHMARFFFTDISDVTALVLDASDMGTSIVFNLFGINDIIVPNLYKGDTDFVTMRARMPSVQSFPMSVEGYIRNWALSNSQNYRTRVIQTAAQSYYPRSKIKEKDDNVKMLQNYDIPYPKQFDMVYLDFCGAFTDNTKDCINDLLSKTDVDNTRSKIIAVTGSVMGTRKKGNDTDTQLDNIITFMNSKGYIMDQTFVYFRRVNHSRVAPGVEIGRMILNIGDTVKAVHPDHGRRYFKGVVVKRYPKTNKYDIHFDDKRVIDREKIVVTDTRRVHRNQISNRGGTKMFFVSFIGTTADDKIRTWNSKFTKCNGTACKLQKDHRYCLFHEKNDTQQSFCNRLLQDFYILTPSKIRRNEDFNTLLGDDVPIDPEQIIEHQKFKQQNNEALYVLQREDWQAYDAGNIQSYIVNSRNIKYKGKRDYKLNIHGVILFVRIECTYKKSVAVSLSGNNSEALRTLDDIDVSDIFEDTRIQCLFLKADTEADHALIFIPKDYFDHLAQDDLNSLVNIMDDMNIGEKKQTKAHKPKAHKPKAHKPKAHKTKAHKPKAHKPKAHQTKAHQTKAHQTEISSGQESKKESTKRYPTRSSRNQRPDYTDIKGSAMNFNQKVPVTSMPKIGRRIEWLWNDDKWYLGTVVSATSSSVTINYDDGTKLTHKREECFINKTWKYIN